MIPSPTILGFNHTSLPGLVSTILDASTLSRAVWFTTINENVPQKRTDAQECRHSFSTHQGGRPEQPGTFGPLASKPPPAPNTYGGIHRVTGGTSVQKFSQIKRTKIKKNLWKTSCTHSLAWEGYGRQQMRHLDAPMATDVHCGGDQVGLVGGSAGIRKGWGGPKMRKRQPMVIRVGQ